MKTDTIVQEARDARAAIAAEFGYDLSKYLAWIREQTQLRKEASGKPTPAKEAPSSYVRRRAAQGSARQMLDILEMAPKVEPEERDRIN
jgi:hypothetical protein